MSAPIPSTMAAIILALGNDLLWADLAGEPVLARAVGVFVAAPVVAEIVVVTDAAHFAQTEQIAHDRGWNARVRVIAADGAGMRDALAAGLAALPVSATVVCAHDGARPFVTMEMLAAGIAATQRTGAATASVPLKETIKRVDQHGMVIDTPDRSRLFTLQTPQIFTGAVLMQALLRTDVGDDSLDAAQIVEQAGIPVMLFPGAYTNLRIATALDLALARALWVPSTSLPLRDHFA